jgi:putative transposase
MLYAACPHAAFSSYRPRALTRRFPKRRSPFSLINYTIRDNRANYYKRRQLRSRRQVDGKLLAQLVIKERLCQPRIGTRKLQVLVEPALGEAGVQMGRDQMFKELRKRELLVEKQRAKLAYTINSRRGLPVFPNRIREMEVKAPNKVWAAGLTYLRPRKGFCICR